MIQVAEDLGGCLDFPSLDLAVRLVSSSRPQQCRGEFFFDLTHGCWAGVEDICHWVRIHAEERTCAEHTAAVCCVHCRSSRSQQWRPYICSGKPQRGGDVATPLLPSLASAVPYRSEERSEPSGTISRDP